MQTSDPLRVGIGGPVGSGKTTLVEMLCKRMRDQYKLAVVTNDIYTKEDERLLVAAEALSADRIMGVETGGCPHTAIREDASINLEAIDRKGGPGITRSDLLVINKIDLAPYVGADLDVMRHDTARMRGDRPWVMTNLKTGVGLDEVIRLIEKAGCLQTG